jgi:hypothetical protein
MSRSLALALVAGVAVLLLLSLGGPTGAAGPTVPRSEPLPSEVVPLASPPPNPFSTGMAASIALGAYNLTSYNGTSPPNATTFTPDPEGLAVDPSGNVWAPDYGGNRVLEFRAPFTTNEPASVVLGQPNFTATEFNTTSTIIDGPCGAAANAAGDIFVSSFDTNRVLEFEPPFSTGMAASVVFGQDTFTGNDPGTSATNLSNPVGLGVDSHGDLWVADSGNNRVLEYAPPFSSGMSASLVLGQPNFTTNGAGLGAGNLSTPQDVAVAGGIVWVADYGNDRVVGFPAPASSGENATYLLGQSSFTGSGATGAGAFGGAFSVSVDSRGDLWVSDYANNRVAEFLPPFTTFENASVVIGQTNLTNSGTGHNATTLATPLGAVVAPNGVLWVTDGGNSRILGYIPTQFSVTFSAVGLPSGTNWSFVLEGATYTSHSPNASATIQNGSYSWTVPAIAGYTVSPSSGTVYVNGSDQRVALAVAAVKYAVTFSETGLPAATGWAVTLGSTRVTSPTNGSITFSEANGSYSYSIIPVAGYSLSISTGSVLVSGAGQAVSVAFTANATSSASTPLGFGLILVIVLILVVLAAVAAVLVMRRRKGGSATTAPGAPGTPGDPPSGSTMPPPPPPAAGGPPPGATG